MRKLVIRTWGLPIAEGTSPRDEGNPLPQLDTVENPDIRYARISVQLFYENMPCHHKASYKNSEERNLEEKTFTFKYRNLILCQPFLIDT